MKAKFVLLTLFSLVVLGCSSEDEGIREKKVTITFINKEKQVLINDSFDLMNELKIENATKEQVVWLSENPSVVRLNGSIGKALSEGEIQITAKVKNTNVQTSMKISVQEQILQFKQKELSLVTNKTFNLNDLLEIKNIELDQLKWTVENSNILTINKGQITTYQQGKVKITVEFGKSKAIITVIVENNELQDIIFDEDIIEITGMQQNKIPYRTLPKGASTAGVKWEISPGGISLFDNETLYSDRLDSSTLTVILPNGKRKSIEVRVVSKGILEIKTPYGTNIKIVEEQEEQFYLVLLPLGETFEDFEVTMDNPIIKIDINGYIKTFFGQLGVTNVTLRSKQNLHVSIIMRVEVISFINDVLVSSQIFDEIKNDGTHTGELQYQLFSSRRDGISIQDFILYDGYNRVIFRDSKTYTLQQIYTIKLNKVYKPYAEFTLMYKGVAIKCRKEVNVVTGIPIPKAF